MKKISLWTIILVVFTTSCTSEHTLTPAATIESPDAGTYFKRDVNASNPANAYDAVGILYADITEEYLSTEPERISIANTIIAIENLANLDSRFLALKPYHYLSPLPARIEDLASSESISINDLPITNNARTSLTQFLDSLMTHQQLNTDFGLIYDYIVDFEAGVVQEPFYTALDLKVLLCTSSIARHAFDVQRKRRKNRDRDWDLSWGSIFAGSEGASTDEAKAIVMSVVTAIELNNN